MRPPIIYRPTAMFWGQHMRRAMPARKSTLSIIVRLSQLPLGGAISVRCYLHLSSGDDLRCCLFGFAHWLRYLSAGICPAFAH
jgi:hypothetical protein